MKRPTIMMTVLMDEDFRLVLRSGAALLVTEDWTLVEWIGSSVTSTAMYGRMECVVVDLCKGETGDLFGFEKKCQQRKFPKRALHHSPAVFM